MFSAVKSSRVKYGSPQFRWCFSLIPPCCLRPVSQATSGIHTGPKTRLGAHLTSHREDWSAESSGENDCTAVKRRVSEHAHQEIMQGVRSFLKFAWIPEVACDTGRRQHGETKLKYHPNCKDLHPTLLDSPALNIKNLKCERFNASGY